MLWLVLGDEDNSPVGRSSARTPGDQRDDVFSGFVVHGLRGIDTQAIEPVFVDPVGSVAAEELADRTRFGSVEVQTFPHSFERAK